MRDSLGPFGRGHASRRVILLACLLFAAACQSMGTSDSSPEQRARQARLTVLDGNDVSIFTREILQRRSIRDYRENPVDAIRRLDAEMRETRNRELAAAIAELAYLQKRRWTNVDVRALATAIRYSYAYVFDPRLLPDAQVFDARFRGMCDLYNAALGEWIRATKRDRTASNRVAVLDWYGGPGSSRLRLSRNELEWRAEEFDAIEVAIDFRVEGLTPPAMRRGIGVPCLVKRAWNRERSLVGEDKLQYRYLPKRVSFPVTLLLRWPDDCSVLDAPQPDASLEALDPIESISVNIAGRAVPIEVDYTTPIAVMLASSNPPSGIDALLHSDEFEKRSALIMFQPVRPDRIPVLFVHGLASGPETWLPLYNRLLKDDTIRKNFQFVFWFYPTGQLALENAARLRRALVEADSAFSNRGGFSLKSNGVICAHSLGGILSNALVTDSGDQLWNTVFTVPPEDLPVDEALRKDLKETLIFEHLPFANRVIYYASPHRGAPDAGRGIVQWASGLIRRPQRTLGQDAKLRGYLRDEVKSKHYTVAQSLRDDNPVLSKLADLPVADGVVYHSIIGDTVAAGRKGGDDGLVPYSSSHLDGAASELIIKSGHSVQHTTAAAAETMRILLEHLAAMEEE